VGAALLYGAAPGGGTWHTAPRVLARFLIQARRAVGLAVLLGPGGALALAPPAVAQEYDLVLRNGRVVDGTGTPWFRADVAVKGDTIVAVGPGLPGTGRRTLDVRDQVVAPGFIDIHTHARRGLLEVPTADNYVLQGVTTVFEGQDGSSPLPLGESLARVAALPPALNFATFVGHGSVREAVMGREDRAPTPLELERMAALVRRSMEEGAFGLSTGLFYVPGAYARTDEVVSLARAAGETRGIHVSHMRDEAAGVLSSVAETVTIGEEGHLPTQVTHHKIIGRSGWGKSVETLRLVAEARARGVDVTIDQYPYTASSTAFSGALFPPWALEGGSEDRSGRLAEPESRSRIREVVIEKIRNERGGGEASRLQIAAFPDDPSLAGQNLADILRGRGEEPTVEAAADLVLEIVERGGATGIFHAMAEEDVERILASPFTMVASDGEVPVFGRGRPHPRSYGTFARVLGVYVREKGLLSLEEAVRKMTSFPAARTGLTERGLLRPGMKADITVFDPVTIRDRATFERPHAYAEGVSTVLVNGILVVDGGRLTGVRPGRVLLGPAATPGEPR
jgi:N-acyl-D-amino-acid deacylase